MNDLVSASYRCASISRPLDTRLTEENASLAPATLRALWNTLGNPGITTGAQWPHDRLDEVAPVLNRWDQIETYFMFASFTLP